MNLLKRFPVLIGAVSLLAFPFLVLIALSLLAFPFLWLVSVDRRYTDVSGESTHAQWVGQRCVVLKGLMAHGFTVDLRKKNETFEVDVTTLPGIGGSEITFVTPIPKGNTFVVTSVRECSNCLFGDRIRYGVEIHDVPELAAYKVFARPQVLASQEVQCSKTR